MAAAAPAQLGKMFGLPGLSRRLENRENNDGLTTTISGTTQTQAIGIQPFQQSDVITHWRFFVTWTNNQTLAGGANTTSTYFPYNVINNFELQLQNQFSPIKVENGIDLAIFQSYRPFLRTGGAPKSDVLGTNLNSMYSAQANQLSASNYTNASTSIKFQFDVPVSVWFDQYFMLAENGSILNGGIPIRALVTPKLMAGTAMVVNPTIQYAAASPNPVGTGGLDMSPFSVAGGAPTYSGSVLQNIKRIGYYQPDRPETIPPQYEWAYQRITRRVLVGAVSSGTYPIQFTGQILSIYVRLWDPTANTNLGGPVPITNITEADVIYGSSLYRTRDRVTETQFRVVRQYLLLQTSGVLLFDFAMNEFGELTNADAVNTLTTAAVAVFLQFSGTQAASCYAVFGIEGLAFVQSN